MSSSLKHWGWTESLEEAYQDSVSDHQAYRPGRVLSQREDTFKIATSEGLRWAHPAGVMFHKRASHERPGVGDWVVLEKIDCVVSETDEAVPVTHSVTDVLPRSACFLREAPGGRGEAQIVATNVDQIFIVNPANDVNLNRIERFCVAICAGGARPGVVLSKGDLVSEDSLAEAVAAAEGLSPGLQVVTTSHAASSVELVKDSLLPVLESGKTYALVGASGVGKSTLVNALMGECIQETGEVREGDRKGRHVTSFRELFPLQCGALLMDTPGVREFALWSELGGLEIVFEDVYSWQQQCRFADCSHLHEPGCRVMEAVEQGELSQRRLDNWRQLEQEMVENEERRERLKARKERSRYRRKVKRDKRFSR